MEWPQPKFSRSQVTKAGKILRNANEHTQLEDLRFAYEALANWRIIHTYPMNTFRTTLIEKARSIDPNALIAQRLKRAPTILDKLKREPTMQLSTMADIGGLRAVVKNMDALKELVSLYKETKFLHELYREHDYVESPKDTGYRSIHFIYKYKNRKINTYDNLQLEIQMRTALQHSWATAVETMAIYAKQPLKSNIGEPELLKFFALAGSAFAYMENSNLVPGHENLSEIQTYKKLIAKNKQLNISQKLEAFTIAAESITIQKGTSDYRLVILDFEKPSVEIIPFESIEAANKAYGAAEDEVKMGANKEVVLVKAGSIASLKKAYPNYFLDSQEFIKAIKKIERKINS